MRKPKELTGEAADFWKRHSQRLIQENLLTDSTLDSFVLLCKIHSKLQTINPETEKNGWIVYLALLNKFQSYSRGFSMNTDKEVKVEKKIVEEKDEFGI